MVDLTDLTFFNWTWMNLILREDARGVILILRDDVRGLISIKKQFSLVFRNRRHVFDVLVVAFVYKYNTWEFKSSEYPKSFSTLEKEGVMLYLYVKKSPTSC